MIKICEYCGREADTFYKVRYDGELYGHCENCVDDFIADMLIKSDDEYYHDWAVDEYVEDEGSEIREDFAHEELVRRATTRYSRNDYWDSLSAEQKKQLIEKNEDMWEEE